MGHPENAASSPAGNHHVRPINKVTLSSSSTTLNHSITRSASRRSAINLPITLAQHVAIDASNHDFLRLDNRDFPELQIRIAIRTSPLDSSSFFDRQFLLVKSHDVTEVLRLLRVNTESRDTAMSSVSVKAKITAAQPRPPRSDPCSSECCTDGTKTSEYQIHTIGHDAD